MSLPNNRIKQIKWNFNIHTKEIENLIKYHMHALHGFCLILPLSCVSLTKEGKYFFLFSLLFASKRTLERQITMCYTFIKTLPRMNDILKSLQKKIAHTFIWLHGEKVCGSPKENKILNIIANLLLKRELSTKKKQARSIRWQVAPFSMFFPLTNGFSPLSKIFSSANDLCWNIISSPFLSFFFVKHKECKMV